jgi:hypothetical protein
LEYLALAALWTTWCLLHSGMISLTANIEDKQFVLAKGSGINAGRDIITHLDSLATDNKYGDTRVTFL